MMDITQIQYPIAVDDVELTNKVFNDDGDIYGQVVYRGEPTQFYVTVDGKGNHKAQVVDAVSALLAGIESEPLELIKPEDEAILEKAERLESIGSFKKASTFSFGDLVKITYDMDGIESSNKVKEYGIVAGTFNAEGKMYVLLVNHGELVPAEYCEVLTDFNKYIFSCADKDLAEISDYADKVSKATSQFIAKLILTVDHDQ